MLNLDTSHFEISVDPNQLASGSTLFSRTFHWLLTIFQTLLRRRILAIFIHEQFESFVQIFMLADLIFKEKSQTINIRKGMFLNINWKIKFPEACKFIGNFWKFPDFFHFFLNFPDWKRKSQTFPWPGNFFIFQILSLTVATLVLTVV